MYTDEIIQKRREQTNTYKNGGKQTTNRGAMQETKIKYAICATAN
jgi:hypothetical protein